MDGLKRHLALFISQALGGPEEYEGREMAEVHQGLGITGEQFDLVAGHLVDTLQEFEVGETEIEEVMAIVGPLKEVIVAATEEAGPPAGA